MIKNVVIYTRDGCSHCKSAKALLKDKGISFKEVNVVTREDSEQLKENFPGVRSFPVITIDGEWIGGYTQLSDRLRNY